MFTLELPKAKTPIIQVCSNGFELKEEDETTFKTFQMKGGFELDFYFSDDFVPNCVEVTKKGNFIAEIGLFFDGISLEDYDGIFELPEMVIDTLEFMGYKIGF